MATDTEEKTSHIGKKDLLRRESVEGQKLSGRFDRVSAFPPYFTVDELWMYRKKKPDASSLRDNLKLEKGSFKFLKTEYMRQFKNFYELLKAKNGNKPIIFTTHPVKPLVNLNLEGHQEYHSQYKESYGKQWINGLENIPMEYETSQNAPQDQSLPLRPLKLGRRLLKKRPTLLKLEGEHYYITEYTDRYIKYAVLERTQLLRTPTHLKLEGGMEDKTETRDTFVKYDNIGRPPLCKKFTQLHLEGSFDFSTDHMRSYPLREHSERPSLVRKSTNLHLEGDLNLTPEYRREYVDYHSPERPRPIVPRNNLKTSGLFDSSIPEEKFTTKLQPLIPFLREPCDSRGGSRPTSAAGSRRGSLKEDRLIPTYAQPQPNLIVTSASESDLVHAKSEYTHSVYLRPDTYRDTSRPKSRRGSYSYKQPEFGDQYVGVPRTRIWKPQDHLSTPGKMDPVKPLYSPRKHVRKKEPVRKDSDDFLLQENFECQPEYRKAYRDILIREKPPLDQRMRAVQKTDKAEKSQSSDESKPINAETTSPTHRPKTSKLPEVVPSKRPPIKPRSTAKRELAHLEHCAFGPRTTTIRRSLSSSPTRRDHLTARGHVTIDRANRSRSHGRRKKEIDEREATRSRWQRRHDVEEDAAFVVLENKFGHRKNIKQALYKEQKWMPAWNYSSHSS